MRQFFSVVAESHRIVNRVLYAGAVVIDATCGNGNDTVWLAQRVGPAGRVYAFDVQEVAVRSTESLCYERGVRDWVECIHAGHQDMDKYIPEAVMGNVAAIMINTGYLPGSDKSIITRPETTIAAIEKGLPMLQWGGVLTVALYLGHPGGVEEARAVQEYCAQLPYSYCAIITQNLNRGNNPPFMIAIERTFQQQQPHYQQHAYSQHKRSPEEHPKREEQHIAEQSDDFDSFFGEE